MQQNIFRIDPNSVPGRVGLSVTALLTLSTHAIGIHYQLPPVSYAKAQDVWFGVCIFFLFSSLVRNVLTVCIWRNQIFSQVEFALVNMYTRRAESTTEKIRMHGQRVNEHNFMLESPQKLGKWYTLKDHSQGDDNGKTFDSQACVCNTFQKESSKETIILSSSSANNFVSIAW